MISRAIASRSASEQKPKLYLVDTDGLVCAVLEMVETTLVQHSDKDQALWEIAEALNERADRERREER